MKTHSILNGRELLVSSVKHILLKPFNSVTPSVNGRYLTWWMPRPDRTVSRK